MTYLTSKPGSVVSASIVIVGVVGLVSGTASAVELASRLSVDTRRGDVALVVVGIRIALIHRTARKSE